MARSNGRVAKHNYEKIRKDIKTATAQEANALHRREGQNNSQQRIRAVWKALAAIHPEAAQEVLGGKAPNRIRTVALAERLGNTIDWTTATVSGCNPGNAQDPRPATAAAPVETIALPVMAPEVNADALFPSPPGYEVGVDGLWYNSVTGRFWADENQGNGEDIGMGMGMLGMENGQAWDLTQQSLPQFGQDDDDFVRDTGMLVGGGETETSMSRGLGDRDVAGGQEEQAALQGEEGLWDQQLLESVRLDDQQHLFDFTLEQAEEEYGGMQDGAMEMGMSRAAAAEDIAGQEENQALVASAGVTREPVEMKSGGANAAEEDVFGPLQDALTERALKEWEALWWKEDRT